MHDGWQVGISGGIDALRRTTTLGIYRTAGSRSDEFLGPDGIIHMVPTETQVPDGCLWTLPSDAIQPLFAALGRHLGSVENPTQLRRDYEAERARVDRLIEHLINPPIRLES